jgi:hypothetical protein
MFTFISFFSIFFFLFILLWVFNFFPLIFTFLGHLDLILCLQNSDSVFSLIFFY